MKTTPYLIALVAGLAAFSALAAPEKESKEKRTGVIDYPFWNSKKRTDSPQFVPGLNAALLLTPAQEEQIAAARGEAAGDPAAAAARGLSKSDPSVTDEQREKAKAAVEAANAKLRERVKAILTPAQNELIGKINSAYADTVEEIGTVYADKFGSVKGNEGARQRVQEEKEQDTVDRLLSKLDTLLTPAQKEAMTRAAEDEHRRSAQAAAAPKKSPK